MIFRLSIITFIIFSSYAEASWTEALKSFFHGSPKEDLLEIREVYQSRNLYAHAAGEWADDFVLVHAWDKKKNLPVWFIKPNGSEHFSELGNVGYFKSGPQSELRHLAGRVPTVSPSGKLKYASISMFVDAISANLTLNEKEKKQISLSRLPPKEEALFKQSQKFRPNQMQGLEIVEAIQKGSEKYLVVETQQARLFGAFASRPVAVKEVWKLDEVSNTWTKTDLQYSADRIYTGIYKKNEKKFYAYRKHDGTSNALFLEDEKVIALFQERAIPAGQLNKATSHSTTSAITRHGFYGIGEGGGVNIRYQINANERISLYNLEKEYKAKFTFEEIVNGVIQKKEASGVMRMISAEEEIFEVDLPDGKLKFSVHRDRVVKIHSLPKSLSAVGTYYDKNFEKYAYDFVGLEKARATGKVCAARFSSL